MMNRRRLLQAMALGAVGTCPVCLSAVRAWAGDPGPHWSYEGEAGPEHWGELSPDFRVCELGLQQSPIDLTGAIDARLSDLELSYRSIPLKVVNNGHTIQVNCAPGSSLTLDRRTWQLVQFHFHHPSEHLVDGQPFAMEAHFVHVGEDGDYAVIGVFLAPGRENPVLEPIWQVLPHQAGDTAVPEGVWIEPAGLFPADRRLYRYYGSLTTPPCTERVVWSVFRAPVEVSPEQIRSFAALYPMNARPVAPLNRRFLLETFSGG